MCEVSTEHSTLVAKIQEEFEYRGPWRDPLATVAALLLNHHRIFHCMYPAGILFHLSLIVLELESSYWIRASSFFVDATQILFQFLYFGKSLIAQDWTILKLKRTTKIHIPANSIFIGSYSVDNSVAFWSKINIQLALIALNIFKDYNCQKFNVFIINLNVNNIYSHLLISVLFRQPRSV